MIATQQFFIASMTVVRNTASVQTVVMLYLLLECTVAGCDHLHTLGLRLFTVFLLEEHQISQSFHVLLKKGSCCTADFMTFLS